MKLTRKNQNEKLVSVMMYASEGFMDDNPNDWQEMMPDCTIPEPLPGTLYEQGYNQAVDAAASWYEWLIFDVLLGWL